MVCRFGDEKVFFCPRQNLSSYLTRELLIQKSPSAKSSLPSVISIADRSFNYCGAMMDFLNSQNLSLASRIPTVESYGFKELRGEPTTLLLVLTCFAMFVICLSGMTSSKGNASFEAPFVGGRVSWLARLFFFSSANAIIQEGHRQYKEKPWKLCGNDVIVLPHRYLDEVRRLPLTQASAMEANLDNMQSSYTHLDVLNTTRLFVTIIKSKVTPRLGILVPTIRKELDLAFKQQLPRSIADGEWISVEAFDTFHKITGMISARIFGGKHLRDDIQWLNAVEGYLNNIFKTAICVRLVPRWGKFIASFFLPCSWEITLYSRRARKILTPYIRHRQQTAIQRGIENAKGRTEEFPDVLEYLIEEAEGSDADPNSLASMVLSLSLASNHTTGMALTEALFDLCTHPEYIPELRKEVQTAIAEESGWQKTSLTRMRKLDSFIKESQRMHPPSLSTLHLHQCEKMLTS